VRIQELHDWNLTPTEAVRLQRDLADRVDARSPLGRFELIAGADVSYERFGKTLFAGVVVLRLPELTVVEKVEAVWESAFPYVPGLLSFREAPALLAAFANVESDPDVVMLDGHGYSHPRRFGLACHIGLWLNRPCLGCAKSRLIGTFGRLGKKVGARAALVDREEIVGAVVRTRTDVKPVFASVGHRIDLDSAVKVILASGSGYRLPEPTRLADQHANVLRRAASC
jgi:deoxyribonuclease V